MRLTIEPDGDAVELVGVFLGNRVGRAVVWDAGSLISPRRRIVDGEFGPGPLQASVDQIRSAVVSRSHPHCAGPAEQIKAPLAKEASGKYPGSLPYRGSLFETFLGGQPMHPFL